MTAVTGDMALAATQIQSAFSNLTWHITTTCEYGLNLQSWNKVSDSSHTVSHCAESSLQVFYCNVGQVKHKSWILKCLSQSGKYCCLTWLSGKLLPNQSDCCEHMNRAMAPSRSAAWWLHRDCQQLLTADRDKKKMDQSLIDDYFFIHKHQHSTSHWQFMVECGCSEGHLHHLWITNTAFMCASLHFTNLSVFLCTPFLGFVLTYTCYKDPTHCLMNENPELYGMWLCACPQSIEKSFLDTPREL